MTYSIAASDSATVQVGGAGTSCLMGDDVYVIYAAVPGRGVVHAQANYNLTGKRRALELLQQEQAPADIVAEITRPSFDRSVALRQYAVVDIAGNAVGFTGEGTMSFAADRQGHVGTFAYSVQGNILTSARVLDQAAGAFEAGGCDLADRLMLALEAGAHGGEGDSRCTPDGIPSDSAFLQVEAPMGQVGDYLALRVSSSGEVSPLIALRQQFDAWRAEHACPAAMPEPLAPVVPMPQAPAVSQPGAPANADAGCGCHVLHADSSAATWLLLIGSLLVVAGRRRLASRQLHPIQPA